MRGIGSVLLGEIPSTKEGNAHSLKIVSENDGVIAQAQCRTGGRPVTLDSERVRPAPKKRQICRASRSGNARRLAQLVDQLFVKRSHPFVLRVFVWRQVDRRGQDILWTETRIGAQDPLEAAHQ